MKENTIARPVLVWAGGKTQLLSKIASNYPNFEKLEIDTYVEPFFGGGAVFFHLASTQNDIIKNKIINDINPNLINLYRIVRDNKDELESQILELKARYLERDWDARKTMYLEKREEFNDTILNPVDPDDLATQHTTKEIERAVLLIFINRTCFNGVYRVNKKGRFNVSFGSKKNVTIFDKNGLEASSRALENTKILLGDYHRLERYVTDSTFVYLDPPYRPISNMSNFNSYDASVFGDDAQRDLKGFVDRCNNKGSKILLSNSDPKNKNPEDNFFDELYADYHIERVPATRKLSSKASTRGAIMELLIKNY